MTARLWKLIEGLWKYNNIKKYGLSEYCVLYCTFNQRACCAVTE